MCGIVGALCGEGLGNTAEISASLNAMTQMVHHRGPDGQDTWTDGIAGLGHARLAVIDLRDMAAQPMSDGDGRFHIVFNGEIYNFRDLRADLEALGHVFTTEGDTEVILQGYRRWGAGVVERLRGMFAFAIWDARDRKLFLARDRFGQKPLYYGWFGGRFLFSSEIKANLAWSGPGAGAGRGAGPGEGIKRRANLDAIHDYLTFQYVPAPKTAFEGVCKLPPAHTLCISAKDRDGTRSVPEPYFSLPEPGEARSIPGQDIKAQLVSRFDEAVRLRMISDVPLGAFLSGGIDSAAVVASMARQSTDRIKTFTIGFDEQAYDERPYARMVADRYGTDHHEEVVRPDAVSLLPKLVWHYGEPFADSSAIPTYYLSQMTRRHVTVALNGDGGDEGFLGYPRYVGAWLASRLDVLPKSLRQMMGGLGRGLPFETSSVRLLRYMRRFLMETGATEADRYGQWISFFSHADKTRLYDNGMAGVAARSSLSLLDKWFAVSGSAAARAAYADIQTYLPDDLLVKVDVATMAHGLEGRSPFLDHELMSLAASVPASEKMVRMNTKALLKDAMADRLPGEILNRPKMGFGVPIERWFRGELKDMAYDVLLSSQARDRGLFRAEEVRRLLDEHAGGARNHHHRIWALLFLEHWFQTWIDGPLPSHG